MTKEEAQQAEAQGKQLECYIYRSRDKKNWKKEKGPFTPSQIDGAWKQEEIEWNATKEATGSADPRGR